MFGVSVMPSLHTLAAAETTFGRVYVHTLEWSSTYIDTFEPIESGYSAETSSPTSRVCKSVLRDVIRGVAALRRRMHVGRLGKLSKKTAFFCARPSGTLGEARPDERARRFSLTSREMNHILFQAARVVRAFTRAPEIERRDRRSELWKENGPD